MTSVSLPLSISHTLSLSLTLSTSLSHTLSGGPDLSPAAQRQFDFFEVKPRANWILGDLRSTTLCIRITQKLSTFLFLKKRTVIPRFPPRSFPGLFGVFRVCFDRFGGCWMGFEVWLGRVNGHDGSLS